MTEGFDFEQPAEEIMVHYGKETERTEEKYDLKKLFAKKAGDATNNSSFFVLGNNENMNVGNQEERLGGSQQMNLSIASVSKRKSDAAGADPFGMDQKIKNL